MRGRSGRGDAPGTVVVEADRVDRAGVRDGRAERHRVQRPTGPGGLCVQPRPEAIERRRTAGRDGPDAGEPGRPRVDGDDPVVVAHHGRLRPPVDEDGGQAHGVRPGPWDRPEAAPRPSRMTSAMPPTPVHRSKAMAAWAMSISEPLAARRPRARAAATSGVSAGT